MKKHSHSNPHNSLLLSSRIGGLIYLNPMRHSLFFFFFFFFFFHGVLASHSSPLRFKLHRRSMPSSSRLEYLRALVIGDQIRQGTIASRIGRPGTPLHNRRRACDSPSTDLAPAPAAGFGFAMPLNSGSYVGEGQFFALFRLGTPAQKLRLIIDTGSDLTWVKCLVPRRLHPGRGGGGKGKRKGKGWNFKPQASSSWHPIMCSSDMCKTSLPDALLACPTPASPCLYEYGYEDGSMAKGFFANESATISLSNGGKAKLKRLVVGCTTSTAGPSFFASDGVLALGFSRISFTMAAAPHFGGRFSYCLVDHLSPRNRTGYLTFGPNPAFSQASSPTSPPPFSSTRLLLTPHFEPWYAVSVAAISLDGVMLPVPQNIWDVEQGGGVIVDSGTSLTMLVEPLYTAVVTVLSQRLERIPRTNMDPFEYCYNWTTGAADNVVLPKLAVHFADSARFEPPSKSYVIDVAVGVKCIGFQAAPWPGQSTIGNILQQEHHWEFDIRNKRLRFKPDKCTP
ncbi:aspartic proteinase NANA, chloroplast-like [Typha latifolia]|uniref:aspartic proteinase NANA, chloroplast-like n=1 Tax=Typha latifolia TaxID=4733 RepID=UPI003C30011B